MTNFEFAMVLVGVIYSTLAFFRLIDLIEGNK